MLSPNLRSTSSFSKIQGEFVWHAHAEEDELFHVVKGQLRMEFRDCIEVVNLGIVIPRVEHRPVPKRHGYYSLNPLAPNIQEKLS